jgi:hypothetical protein
MNINTAPPLALLATLWVICGCAPSDRRAEAQQREQDILRQSEGAAVRELASQHGASTNWHKVFDDFDVFTVDVERAIGHGPLLLVADIVDVYGTTKAPRILASTDESILLIDARVYFTVTNAHELTGAVMAARDRGEQLRFAMVVTADRLTRMHLVMTQDEEWSQAGDLVYSQVDLETPSVWLGTGECLGFRKTADLTICDLGF